MTETISSAKELAREYIAKGTPVFVSGPPGVGKSDMFKQLADEAEIGFIDLRLGMMDPVDLLGLPHIKDGETTWGRPAFWPNVKRDGEQGIILFDELPDASRSMQSAAYQIILNGRAGPHVLPKGWYRCAAGNRRQDRAAANALSTALANRFAHIDVDADAKAWIQWANSAGIHYLITGFIHFRPAMLHNMEGTDLRAFPTPRSWSQASKFAEIEGERRFKLVRGCVGEGAAGEFEAYMRTVDLPDLEDILANPKKLRIPEQPSSKYALSSMLARYADRDNFGKIMLYISRPEFGRDFEICTVLDATKRDPLLTESRAFVDFANRNQDLTL